MMIQRVHLNASVVENRSDVTTDDDVDDDRRRLKCQDVRRSVYLHVIELGQ